MARNYWLSPSDLTFLYDGCPRCFVLKVKHGVRPPSIPLPAVFTTIAELQKERYAGVRLDALAPGMPRGVVKYGEERVRSEPIPVPGSESTCTIAGRFDAVAELDDGAYAVVDFKTGVPEPSKTDLYARQLHAYAFALERPAPEALRLAPVTRLGLLYFSPDACEARADGRQAIAGSLQWVEVARDDGAFLRFLADAVALLDGPLPAPAAGCEWCRYIATARGVSMPARPAPPAPRPHAGEAAAGMSVPDCPRCGGPMRLRDGRFGRFWSCTRFPDCRGSRDAA